MTSFIAGCVLLTAEWAHLPPFTHLGNDSLERPGYKIILSTPHHTIFPPQCFRKVFVRLRVWTTQHDGDCCKSVHASRKEFEIQVTHIDDQPQSYLQPKISSHRMGLWYCSSLSSFLLCIRVGLCLHCSGNQCNLQSNISKSWPSIVMTWYGFKMINQY